MLSFKQFLEEKDDPCWKGYEMVGMKKKGKRTIPNCVPIKETFQNWNVKFSLGEKIRVLRGDHKGKRGTVLSSHDNGSVYKLKHTDGTILKHHISTLAEATYQGRKVTLNKPMPGDVKKSKVYVDPDGDGKAKKVEFGDPNMTIKKNIPARRKSFRARHNCDNPGPKDKARYWSCRAW